MRKIVLPQTKTTVPKQKIRKAVQASIAEKAAYIERLEKRLEITEEYDIDGNTIPIPPEDRDRAIDGITARDCTIRLQDDRIKELETWIKKLKASAKKQCRVGRGETP